MDMPGACPHPSVNPQFMRPLYFLLFTLLGLLNINRSHLLAAETTLPAAICEALKNHPEMRALEAAVASAKGGVTSARTFSNPELSIAPGVKRVVDPELTRTEFHGNFELSQTFEFPGKRALKTALAQKNVRIQELAIEGFRFELKAKVRRAFYELLTAQKAAQLRQEQVESAQTFVQSAKKRAEGGYASDFEVMKSQADLIAAERDLLDSKGKIASARVTLNTLMGRSPSAQLSLSGNLEGMPPRFGSPAELMALAMARHPSLRTLDVQAETAGLNLRSARLARLPDFSVGPQVEYTQNEQIYGLGITVALPLWDRKRGEILTANAEQKKILAEIEKTRQEIAGGIVKSAEALQTAREQAALYTPEFLAKLKKLVAQAEESYAQSATTLIVYLDAKRTYFETLAQYNESLGNVAQQTAELESAVGVTLEIKP